MKKIIYILSVVYCLVAQSSLSKAQENNEVISSVEDNTFSNRTLEQEEQVEEYNLPLSGSERVYTLRIGDIARVNGTLFNTEAVAWLETRSEFTHRYYLTIMNFRLNELRTTARLHIDSLNLRLQTQEQANQVIVENLNSQLTTCQSNLNDSNGTIGARERRRYKRRTIMIAIGSSLASAVAASYITYLVVQH